MNFEFCPYLGGVLLCLELETGCKINGTWFQNGTKPPIILVLIFAVFCSLQILPLPISDPVCFPCRCRCRVPSQQAACSTSLFPGLLLALCQALSLSHLEDALPGPEFLTERWKLHGTGWGAGIC